MSSVRGMKKCILLLGLCALLLTAAALAPSLAWYRPVNADFGPASINGHIRSAYFESGDGTVSEQEPEKEHAAYEIKYPEQFYNLAWLQYLGYFNKAYDADGNEISSGQIQPTYFYLSADLDMTGYVLPPIGTRDYPFIGNFDGNNKTVSNLTVSNVLDSEDMAVDEQLKNAEIVGVFGVVGSLAAETNGTESSAALDVEKNYTYSSITNKVKNVTFANVTVETKTANALAGLAAGYVNGTLENVAVSGAINSTGNTGGVTVPDGTAAATTTKLSNYTTVGYCTEPYRGTQNAGADVTHTVSVTTGTYTQDSGEGGAWGGSIDMKSLFDRLDNVYEYTKTLGENGWNYYYADAVSEDGKTTYTTKIPVEPTYNSATNWKGYYNYNWDDYAEYSFPAYNNNSSGGYAYNVVYGADNTAVKQASGQTLSTVTKPVLEMVRIGKDGNYLSYDETTRQIQNATDAESAKKWMIAEVDNGEIICTRIGNDTYYLYNQNGTLSLSISDGTVWTKTTNIDGTVTYQYGSQYLEYDTAKNEWGIKGKRRTFQVKYNNYYMTTGDGNWAYSQTGSGSVWTMDEDGYLSSGGYYLGVNGTYAYSYSNKTHDNVKRWDLTSNANGIYLKIQEGGDLYYSNRYWRVGNSDGVATIEGDTVLTTPNCELTVQKTGEKGQVRIVTATTQDALMQINDSVFPITINEKRADNGTFPNPYTSETGGRYTTDTKQNTGYFVGGAENSDGDHLGNLRIAQYPTTQLYTAMGGSTRSAPYPTDGSMKVLTRTATSDGFKTIKDSYYATSGTSYSNEETTGNGTLYLAKYTESRDAVDKVFSGSRNSVHGLHFMNADIGKKDDGQYNTLTIPKAYINGTEYTDYQLPRNSIDFNLKDSGFINFFAHTGYVNKSGSSIDWGRTNNCFFSLHQIYRDEQDRITDIKEISKVYKNPSTDARLKNTYLYQYEDKTWSNLSYSMDDQGKVVYQYNGVGTVPVTYNNSGTSDPTRLKEEDLTLAFDTDWITNPGMTEDMLYSVFYFEVPANPGEYALGSVSGSVSTQGGTYTANGAYLFYLDIGASAQKVERTISTETITTTAKVYEYPKGVGFKAPAEGETLKEDAAVALPFGSSATANWTGDVVTVTTAAVAECSYAGTGVTVKNGTADLVPKPLSGDVTTKIIRTVTDKLTGTGQTLTWVDLVDAAGIVLEGLEKPDSTTAKKNLDITLMNSATPLKNKEILQYSYSLANSEITVAVDARFTYDGGNCADAVTLTPTGGEITVSITNVNDCTVTVNGIARGEKVSFIVSPLSMTVLQRLKGLFKVSTVRQDAEISSELPSVTYAAGGTPAKPNNYSVDAVEALTIPTPVTLHWTPPISAFPWEDMTDEEFMAWLLDEENAKWLVEILGDETTEAYQSLLQRIEDIEDEAQRLAAEARLEELRKLLAQHPWEKQTDEDFVYWLSDDTNLVTIRNILADEESDAYASLLARVTAIKDEALRAQAEARLALIRRLLPKKYDWDTQTDEDFVYWLRDDTNVSAVRAALDDPLAELSLRERIRAIVDAALRALAEARLEEIRASDGIYGTDKDTEIVQPGGGVYEVEDDTEIVQPPSPGGTYGIGSDTEVSPPSSGSGGLYRNGADTQLISVANAAETGSTVAAVFLPAWSAPAPVQMAALPSVDSIPRSGKGKYGR